MKLKECVSLLIELHVYKTMVIIETETYSLIFGWLATNYKDTENLFYVC